MTIRDSAEVALENLHVVNLVQALIGSITANMRGISLECLPDGVRFHFVLERDDAADREEIDDVAFEFEALLEGPARVDVIVSVSADEAWYDVLPGRRVYGRKESWPGESGESSPLGGDGSTPA